MLFRSGVTVRELGAPEGGTLGGSNDKMLMALAFLLTFGLGCGLILVIPGVVARWRSLGEADKDQARAATGASIRPVDEPQQAADELILPPYPVVSKRRSRSRKAVREAEHREPERHDSDETKPPVTGQPATTG